MESLRDQAYTEIRRRVVSLALPPGSTIDENHLRRELDLGRTPIREALLRLSKEGLVTIVPRRGMFVADIGITDLRQLYEIRVVMEPLAMRFATRRGKPEHWERMAESLSRLPPEGTPNENDYLIEVDEQCHMLIYEAAQNPHLTSALSTWYTLSLRLWYYFIDQIGGMRDAIVEHRSMLDALQAGDEDRAAELMEQHIKTFQQEIQTAMLG